MCNDTCVPSAAVRKYYEQYEPQLTKHLSSRNGRGAAYNKASTFDFDLKKLSRRQVRSKAVGAAQAAQAMAWAHFPIRHFVHVQIQVL